MKTKKIKIGDKEVELRELSYVQGIELQGLEQKEMARKLIELSTTLTPEGIAELSLKEGLELQKQVLEFNGLSETQDFQKPRE